MEQIVSFVSFVALYGLSYGVVLFLISIGLVLTMGLMRVVNLAHGSFAAVGGYFCAFLMNEYGVPYGVAVIVAILAVAVASIPIERIFYAKLYGASELDQVLLTIGLVFATVAAITLIFGPISLKAPPNTLPNRRSRISNVPGLPSVRYRSGCSSSSSAMVRFRSHQLRRVSSRLGG